MLVWNQEFNRNLPVLVDPDDVIIIIAVWAVISIVWAVISAVVTATVAGAPILDAVSRRPRHSAWIHGYHQNKSQADQKKSLKEHFFKTLNLES